MEVASGDYFDLQTLFFVQDHDLGQITGTNRFSSPQMAFFRYFKPLTGNNWLLIAAVAWIISVSMTRVKCQSMIRSHDWQERPQSRCGHAQPLASVELHGAEHGRIHRRGDLGWDQSQTDLVHLRRLSSLRVRPIITLVYMIPRSRRPNRNIIDKSDGCNRLLTTGSNLFCGSEAWSEISKSTNFSLRPILILYIASSGRDTVFGTLSMDSAAM